MPLFSRLESTKNLIASDLYRHTGNIRLKSFLSTYVLSPGFNFTVWFRLCSEFNSALLKYILLRKRIRFGIDIYAKTRIDKGFYIGHFGTIIVSSHATIGKNCNISQGVTIGKISKGNRAGAPVIGNGVYIGPGAKLIGCIRIGNNVAIGANAVIINDVPDNAVVVGIPGKVVSLNGASDYLDNVI